MALLQDWTAGAYGSDEAGLICGYLFDAAASTPARAVNSVQAAQWLADHPADADAPAGGAYMWLHFNLSHAQAERWLTRHAGLSDVFFETLKEGLHSTRIERADDSLIAVINDVHFDFSFEPSEISTLWIKRAQLGMLRRVLVRLQRLLAPEPAALFRLLQNPPAWIDESDAQQLAGATEEFSVVLRDMAALQERIKLLQEEIADNVNEDNNRSLFGMNVGGIPLAEHKHGFWIVVGIVVTFTAAAAWLAFRKKR